VVLPATLVSICFALLLERAAASRLDELAGKEAGTLRGVALAT
jgi:hypothetical protein